MCGFVGAFGPSVPTLTPNLPQAQGAISHRGPDGSGSFSDAHCLMGHQRLAILDLTEAAAQPMERGDGVLAYNGQIYNHGALRSGLPARHLKGHGDTETLCVGLLEKGLPFLGALEGMFAGAFYHQKSRSLSLFRDPLGIKPLYWKVLQDGTWVFASEIKAILALTPDESVYVDTDQLGTYLAFENLLPDQTLFEGVSILKPGATVTLSLSPNGVDAKWGTVPLPVPDAVPTSEDELEREIHARVKQSVESHLLSDVPLGVYLSGGIDSSIVFSVASRARPDLMAFTGYFSVKDPFYDERALARELAQEHGKSLVEVPITAGDFQKRLDPLIHSLDEPRMGMGSFSQFCVADKVAEHRKVILAGHGGDELFAGYPQFKSFALSGGGFKEGLRRLSLTSGKQLPWLAYHFLKRLQGRTPFAPELFPHPDRFPADRSGFELSGSAGSLDRLRAYYHEVYLPGLLLVEDKVSMGHGLETRVPFWSQSLVRWAEQIDVGRLLPGGELKGRLKLAFRKLLPQRILGAPKRGFPTPLRLWFRSELDSFVSERLLDTGNSVFTDLFPRREVEGLLRSHRSVPLPFALDERRAHRVWMLLCLESWTRQFRVGVAK